MSAAYNTVLASLTGSIGPVIFASALDATIGEYTNRDGHWEVDDFLARFQELVMELTEEIQKGLYRE